MIDLSKPDLWWTAGPWAVLWPEVGLLSYADVVELLRGAEPGLWREVVSWPHEEVEQDGFVVPLFAPEPERAGWRRRRWWGRRASWEVGRDYDYEAVFMAPGAVERWRELTGRDDVPYTLFQPVLLGLDLANDGGVCEPLLWEGDQA